MEVTPINYPEYGPDQRCLITHNGTLGQDGGFKVKRNGTVKRKAGVAERLAKRWLLAKGFQLPEFKLVTINTADYF